MKIHAKDIIAGICIVGGGYLLSIGHDGFITTALALILGYYFTHREKK